MAESDNSFSSLEGKVDSRILAAIDAMGFTTMTPVQAATIPLLLSYKDVAAEVCLWLNATHSVFPHTHLYSLLPCVARVVGRDGVR